MSVCRHTRRLEATKELFIPVTSGTDLVSLGAWTGYRLDTDNDYAYVNLYAPHDLHRLQAIRLVVLPLAALTPMILRIVSDYAAREEAYFMHNEQVNFALNSRTNVIQEVDIGLAYDLGPVLREDYIGVQASRQSGQNTNLIVLGVRLRYE